MQQRLSHVEAAQAKLELWNALTLDVSTKDNDIRAAEASNMTFCFEYDRLAPELKICLPIGLKISCSIQEFSLNI